MIRSCIGIDTSCYTTSVACVSDEGIVFEKRTMLSVPLGTRGLRQSEAMFQHVRNLPLLMQTLFLQIDRRSIESVAVSATPTAAPDSYMPVFLAGRMAAVSAAAALDRPLIETTHQAGHVRAALFGNEDLLDGDRILALHLSGGTTDVLLVSLKNRRLDVIEPIGGSEDLHAGQFVDRMGVRLGLPFPSGVLLEQLANTATKRDIRLPSTVRELRCSLSGQETQAQRYYEAGIERAEIAYAVYDCLGRTVGKLIEASIKRYGSLPVLLSGGVSGSELLRVILKTRTEQNLRFAHSGLSSDNAVGAAFLALDRGSSYA
ncbi:MAG: O-sialoglycoprotein endopeptidase [Clostridia bacterium]